MASKRFLIVPEDSSAARMPLPGATMARATLFNSSRFIALSRNFSPLSYSQHLDPRQGLPLQPFQESAAGCGYIAQAVGHARDIERRYRIAAARDRDKF